ncbi:MAG: hypothetical protein EAZ78_13800 [Oscillatoriales cyanobacterium]|nr:MAG: hypothetical protein EA000_08080 [Oscillatoriales cyanobacterium]TAD94885.1 MAG: hypothetical protein EAZ98_17685 [Oscillatoriales cyanobacterium]TAE05242.1 MAG: hypothetical protein EAZ96_06195 [Oscillatoriales cyanobacterium]TAF02990.1 MAG: hypothetical protein EAZ78_13800 [Oscillatoriales cyanobacterium]TAF71315.1 MAG: hypothetical protein EAZ59_01460 [Oscillatoriales cyanobacterium]
MQRLAPTKNPDSEFPIAVYLWVWAKHLGHDSPIRYRIFRPNASPLRVMESGIDTWQLTSSKIV